MRAEFSEIKITDDLEPENLDDKNIKKKPYRCRKRHTAFKKEGKR